MQVLSSLTLYILTLGLAALIPGPGMTGILFRTLAQGHLHGLIMLFGLMTGDLFFLLLSLFGMSTLAKINADIFNYLIVFSCGYLIYLSHKFWRFTDTNQSKPQNNIPSFSKISSYSSGLLISLSNPKTINFYLALVPIILGNMLFKHSNFEFIIVLATLCTLAVIGSLYIFFAIKMKRHLSHAKTQKIIFKMTSILMFCLSIKMLYTALNSMHFKSMAHHLM